jgi:hypothetical protein
MVLQAAAGTNQLDWSSRKKQDTWYGSISVKYWFFYELIMRYLLL